MKPSSKCAKPIDGNVRTAKNVANVKQSNKTTSFYSVIFVIGSFSKKSTIKNSLEQTRLLLLIFSAYHMECLNPALSEPPPGEWFCRLCI